MLNIGIQFFGGRGGGGSGGARGGRAGGGGGAAKAAETNSLDKYRGKSLDTVRDQFIGKTAADVQAEKSRIFVEMGRPSGGSSAYAEFKARTAALNILINETINNGTGNDREDYKTLMRTSVVKKKGR